MAIICGKYCCNCAYWNGNRKVAPTKDRVEVVTGAQGECMNSKAVNAYRKKKKANDAATCNKFEKWQLLK